MPAPRKLRGLFVPGAQRGDFLVQGAQALRALLGRKGDLPKDGGYGLRVVFRRYGEPINPENRFLLIEAPLFVQGKQHLVERGNGAKGVASHVGNIPAGRAFFRQRAGKFAFKGKEIGQGAF